MKPIAMKLLNFIICRRIAIVGNRLRKRPARIFGWGMYVELQLWG